MIRLLVIFEWETDGLSRRLFAPLRHLHDDGKLLCTFKHTSKLEMRDVGKNDIILMSNVISRIGLMAAEEAALRRIRFIYDDTVGETLKSSAVSDGIVPEQLRISLADVRAINVRERLRYLADLVTAGEEDAGHARKVGGGGEREWLAILEGVLGSSERKEAGTGGKHIFLITPTFLWPHHHISDILARTLMEMGHHVTIFTLKADRFHGETLTMEEQFADDHLRRVSGFMEEAWRIPLLMDRERPDMILAVQGYLIPRQVLAEISARGVPAAAWFMDEPYDTMRSAPIGRFFTHVFVQDSSSVEFHRRHGCPNTFFLPHGCDPAGVHSQFPALAEPVDVALVGTPFPRRIELVKNLQEKGISVNCVGAGWEKVEGLPAADRSKTLSLAEAAGLYRSARIVLNMHRAENDFTTNPGLLAARTPNCSTFYIAGSGGFQLADDSRPELADFFSPGTEIVTCGSPREWVEKVQYFLGREGEREEISRLALSRSLSEHTYRHRLQSMLDMVEAHLPVPVDTGYRTVGFIQMGGSISEETKVESGDIAITLLGERGATSALVSPTMRIVTPGTEGGFAKAINGAIFGTSCDYLVCGGPDIVRIRRLIEGLIPRFRTDIHLAMIVFRDKIGSVTGFMVSVRHVMNAGGFDYLDGSLAVEDMKNRLLELGKQVAEIPLEGSPLGESHFSRTDDTGERSRFLARWTKDLDSRLSAHRLMRLGIDNAWRLTGEDAHSIMEEVVKQAPDFLDGRKYLAQLLVRENKVTEAIAHMKYIVEITPDDVSSGLVYATTLLMEGRDAEAGGVLDMLLELEATSQERGSAFFLRGMCHKRQGDNATARGRFMEAFVSDSTHIGALRELALLSLEAGNSAEALEFMKRRVAIVECDETLNDLAVVHWRSGNSETAYDLLKRALKQNPLARESLANVAEIGRELGRTEESRDLVARAAAMLPGDRGIDQLFNSLG
jgi:spore maturation protein CgeB